MSRRLAFLIGHLSGLILGAVLILILLSFQSAPNRPALNLMPTSAVMTPVDYPAPPAGWEQRYFKGRPFYIVPLEAAASIKPLL